jgi:ribosome recycling factor
MSTIILSEDISQKTFEKYVNDLMQESNVFLEKELQKIRTNRAHPSLIEELRVQAYGNIMLLKDLAVVAVIDNQTLSVQPFDIGLLNEIEKALTQDGSLGAMPRNDGKMLKITLPSMSQTRRQELIKIAHKNKELALVGLRKTRQDVLQMIKDAEKNKKISEDLGKRLQKIIQSSLDNSTNFIETIAHKKEQAILE